MAAAASVGCRGSGSGIRVGVLDFVESQVGAVAAVAG